MAELCDNDRLMGVITPSGISLVAHAKKDLNMPSELVIEGAGKQRWIDANNLPGMVKLLWTLLDSERAQDLEVDWLWMEISSISVNDLHLA